MEWCWDTTGRDARPTLGGKLHPEWGGRPCPPAEGGATGESRIAFEISCGHASAPSSERDRAPGRLRLGRRTGGGLGFLDDGRGGGGDVPGGRFRRPLCRPLRLGGGRSHGLRAAEGL